MKKLLENKTIVYSVIVLTVLLIATISATYAYFTTTMNGSASNVTVTSAKIDNVTFSASSINANGILPGWSSEEMTLTVSVSNTDYDIPYECSLNVNNNELTELYLFVSGDNAYTENNAVKVTSGAMKLSSGILSNTNKSYSMKYQLKFKETGTDQNGEQGKSLNAVVTCALDGANMLYYSNGIISKRAFAYDSEDNPLTLNIGIPTNSSDLKSEIDETDEDLGITLSQKNNAKLLDITTDEDTESTLKIAVSDVASSGETILLLRYNTDNLEWEKVGEYVVNSNNEIITSVSEFGTFALINKGLETFTVTYKIGDNTIYTENVNRGNNVQNIPSITQISDMDGYHKGWSHDGTNIESDLIINAIHYYLLTFEVYDNDGKQYTTLSTNSYKLLDTDSKSLNIYNDEIDLEDDPIVTSDFTESYAGTGWYIDDNDTKFDSENNPYTVTGDTLFTLYADYSCILKGTKITMGDGSIKNVEDITTDDEVLSYSYYSGNLESSKVMSIWKGYNIADVLTVTLENGSTLSIADEENLFDTDNKEFILINRDTYQNYIGTNVMINDNGKISYSKIVSIELERKEVEHYTLYTNKTLSYVANNIVAMFPFYFSNIRYTIGNDYKIDMFKYNLDVVKYGTYTYEDFKDVCTKETFDSLSLKDMKAVVSKGIVTLEELKQGVKELQEEIDINNK